LTSTGPTQQIIRVVGKSMVKASTIYFFIFLVFLTGCAYGPPKGWEPEERKTFLDLPFDKAWQRCLTVLKSIDYGVETSDKSQGLIITTKQVARFDPAQEDCGNILNLPLLKESPGDVSIVYQLRLVAEGSRTQITIDTDIRPLSPPMVHTHNVQTFCYSTGLLEKALLDNILSGQPKR
jgi:uncharacterized lipoprotein